MKTRLVSQLCREQGVQRKYQDLKIILQDLKIILQAKGSFHMSLTALQAETSPVCLFLEIKANFKPEELAKHPDSFH